MALAATAALVAGLSGGRTPFAALAQAFFSPPEPGSVIFWRLPPRPPGEGRGEGARGEGKAYVQWGGRWCDNPGDWCNRFYWGQCRTRIARCWRLGAGTDASWE